MYVVTNAIKNLMRYHRRYLIAVTGLTAVLTFCFYGLAYYPSIRNYNAVCREELLSRVEFRFRDDLQYMGDRCKDETTIRYADEAENFNADGSMDGFDYDLYADREYFEQFLASPYVEEMELGYACRVYAEMQSGHELDPSRKGLVLYGGSLNALNCYWNEMQYRDYPREVSVAEGRAPGAGECMLYKDMADYNGLEIGDEITLYDETGEELIRLRISGLAVCRINYGDRTEEEDVAMLGYRIGSMPYRRLATTLLYHVFTDFDTAYSVYGEEDSFAEHHTFNHYIPVFKLYSPEMYEMFASELAEFSYDENLYFYPMTRAAHSYLREYEEKAALLTVLISGTLSFAAAFVMLWSLLRGRSHETGILMAVGAENRKIFSGWLIESAVFLVFSAGIAFVLAANMDGILGTLGTSYFIRQFSFELSWETVSGMALMMICLFGMMAAEIFIGLNAGRYCRKMRGG